MTKGRRIAIVALVAVGAAIEVALLVATFRDPDHDMIWAMLAVSVLVLGALGERRAK